MYRNKKYRSGAALGRTNVSNSTSIASLRPTVTSTPNENTSTVKEKNQHNVPSTSGRNRSPESRSSADDEIPASQFIMPSRYISQRSVRTQSQLTNAQSTSQSNYFESVLQKCNVQLSARNSETSFILKCDHLEFVNSLRKQLKAHPKYPENINTFLNGLIDAMRNSTQMIKLLSGCIISLPGTDLTKPSQESLMNDFLMIDFLQSELIDIILTKVKTLSFEDNTASLMHIELLLMQLKFVDHQANGETVCDKLMNIFESASNAACETIVKGIEDIVDLTRHNAVTERLMQLLPDDNQLLTAVMIETFSKMNLNADTHTKLCHKIFNYMKSNGPMELLPCFTKFVLSFNYQDAEKISSLINQLRSSLRWPQTVVTTTRAVIQKNQREVFCHISQALIRSKQLFDAWLKRIQSETTTKPIDFIVFLLMMTINDERSNYIENIIRRKIRSEKITIKTLEDVAGHFPSLLMDYSKVFFDIMQSFAHDKCSFISNIGSAAYRIAFGIENCDRRELLSKLVGFICERHTTSQNNDEMWSLNLSDLNSIQHDITTNALLILTEINRKHPKEMQNNGLQILRILDVSSELNLSQFRMVMDILCSLAFTQPPCDMLRDHIDILVKKQVTSSIQNVKSHGIIGIVRIIDHIIWRKENSNNETALDASFNTIDDLPNEVSKDAATYFELMMSSTENSVQHLILVFDELSSIFLLRNKATNEKNYFIDRPFLIWLGDTLTKFFEDNFIVDQLPESAANLPLEYVRSLNDEDESSTSGQIGVNIAGNALNLSSSCLASLDVLPSLFNVMRILCSRRYEGSLKFIDAVLGAPVVWPEMMSTSDSIDFFDELNDVQARKVLHMHFYTVNFWRESISAFVNQEDAQIRRKVLIRLSQMIALEKRIEDILQNAPADYMPPVCSFHAKKMATFKRPLAPGRPSAKRTRTGDKTATTQTSQQAETNETRISQNRTTKDRPTTSKSLDFQANRFDFYRPMDPDVMLLFENELIPQYPLPPDQIGKTIGLSEFRFLIEDLLMKIESIYGVRKYSNNSSYIHYIAFPVHFLSDIIQILPKIMHFYEQLTKHLEKLIEKNENSSHDESAVDMENDEAIQLRKCFGLCLRLFAALLSWPGFDNDKNQILLKDALLGILSDGTPPNTNLANVVLKTLSKIQQNVDIILDLQAAEYVVDMSKTLIRHLDSQNAYNDYVMNICEKFLSKNWTNFIGSELRTAESNALLDKMLQFFFKDSKISFLRKQLIWISSELKDFVGKNSALKTFPCFKKNNFALLYRAIYAALIEAIHRKLDKKANSCQLNIWENACAVVNQLLEVAKLVDISRVFSIFLKNTHTYIKLFLQHGMTTVELFMRRDAERVLVLLKGLQNSTRFLHTLCCHSKEIKNISITVQIPPLRETITQLVYKVKGALAANKCSSAFWMGNLKNKNLYGEDILSQTTSITGSINDADVPMDEEHNEDARKSTKKSRKKSSGKSKKRRLRNSEVDEAESNMVDDEDGSNQSDGSRSRCF